MLHGNHSRAQRDFDLLLRQAPDQMRRVLEEGSFTPALEQLRYAGDPAPAWVRARAQNLRLKYGCAAAELEELAQKLRRAREAWLAEGGEDQVRLNQAELALTQLEAKRGEMERMKDDMKALIRAAARAEADAETAELAQALQRLRAYGRETAE